MAGQASNPQIAARLKALQERAQAGREADLIDSMKEASVSTSLTPEQAIEALSQDDFDATN